MEENKPVKKRPILLIVALGFFGMAIAVGMVFYQMKSGLGGDYNATLFLSAKTLNLTCPQELGNGVRLDSAVAKRDLQFYYYYTMTTAEKDEGGYDEFCESYEEGIIENLAGSKDMVDFGQHDVTLIFNMRDANGEMMCSVVLPPSKYYVSPAN